jgi:hypothetical protein
VTTDTDDIYYPRYLPSIESTILSIPYFSSHSMSNNNVIYHLLWILFPLVTAFIRIRHILFFTFHVNQRCYLSFTLNTITISDGIYSYQTSTFLHNPCQTTTIFTIYYECCYHQWRHLSYQTSITTSTSLTDYFIPWVVGTYVWYPRLQKITILRL